MHRFRSMPKPSPKKHLRFDLTLDELRERLIQFVSANIRHSILPYTLCRMSVGQKVAQVSGGKPHGVPAPVEYVVCDRLAPHVILLHTPLRLDVDQGILLVCFADARNEFLRHTSRDIPIRSHAQPIPPHSVLVGPPVFLVANLSNGTISSPLNGKIQTHLL